MMHEVHKLLKAQRIDLGFTQLEIAKELGYTSPQFVSNWERGICLPPLSDVPLLCQILKLNYREITKMIIDLETQHIWAKVNCAYKDLKGKR